MDSPTDEDLGYVEYQMFETRRLDGKRDAPVSPATRTKELVPRSEAETWIKALATCRMMTDMPSRIDRTDGETVVVLFPETDGELKLRYRFVKKT